MAGGAQLVKELYGAFAQGDIPAVLGMMDERIEWREPPGLPFESQVGKQALVENVFAKLGGMFQEFVPEPEEFIDAGDVVVTTGRYRGTTIDGHRLEAPFAHVWRVADDKVVGMEIHTDTLLWDRALSGS